MANQFAALPTPAGNGSGAAVDVSTFGGLKTVTSSGNGFTLEPTVTIEFSNELVPLHFAPLWLFGKPDEKVLSVAARWMRATVSNYRGGGAPVVSVGGDDDDAQFATLVAPAGNGNGAGAGVSTLGSFKTIHVADAFRGALNLEISEDGGVTYSQICTFYGPGYKSLVFAAEFMRVTRVGVPQVLPGLPIVNIGSVSADGDSASVSFQQRVGLVNAADGNDATGAFGTLRAFQTIQAAIDAIPTPAIGDSVASRQVFTILISPGTYDEDLVVDITRKRIILASMGPWNLGLFNSADWAPSGVRRNITISTTDGTINDGIRNGFSIQPMLPAGEGLTTHQAYLTRPRISGLINCSAVAGPSFELTLSCEIFGSTGSAAGDSIIGGAAIVQSYIYHSRLRGKLTGANWNFQVNERTQFGGLVTVSGYSTIISCRFGAGMTTTSAANAGILPGGFYNTDFAGTFTGPAGSLRLDGSTNYWFKTNGALLAGGATKVIQDDLVP